MPLVVGPAGLRGAASGLASGQNGPADVSVDETNRQWNTGTTGEFMKLLRSGAAMTEQASGYDTVGLVEASAGFVSLARRRAAFQGSFEFPLKEAPQRISPMGTGAPTSR